MGHNHISHTYIGIATTLNSHIAPSPHYFRPAPSKANTTCSASAVNADGMFQRGSMEHSRGARRNVPEGLDGMISKARWNASRGIRCVVPDRLNGMISKAK